MTSHPDIFSALAAPFAAREVKQRPGGRGTMLSYTTARVVMNRFDSVLGPENWRDTYTETKDGIRCRIEIRLPGTTEWLWKEDGGGFADMPEEDNVEKSGYSDAFKRAAVKWGPGRYLYQDGTADFGDGSHQPAESRPAPRQSPPPSGNGNGHHAPPRPQQQDGGGRDDAPRTGRALFAWVKKQEEQHGVALLKWLNAFVKETMGDLRMVDLDERQVARVHREALVKLGESEGNEDEHAPPVGRGQGDEVPFDHGAAMDRLRTHAAGLAAHIFRPFLGTDAEVDSALQSLDPAVPEHLRVADWSSCADRESMRAYYAAATTAIRDYEHEDIPR